MFFLQSLIVVDILKTMLLKIINIFVLNFEKILLMVVT